MATFATWLLGVRYDLRNYGDIDFDPDLIMHYLNRAITLMEQSMVQFNSDQTLTQSDVTLTSGNNYADCPTRCLALREVWIGQDRKQAVDQQELYYRRRFRTSDTAQPNYWAHVKNDIEFEVTADQNYTLVVIFDQGTADITATSDNMPYESLYNDVLREVVVQMCYNKKYKADSQTDAIYAQVFDGVFQNDMVNRKFWRKQYRLDF
jgi:hypothetical protein